MARKFRVGGRKRYKPMRPAYRMTNGRIFYEKRGDNQGAYDVKFHYVQKYYWVDGYTVVD